MDELELEFELAPQLKADTINLGDFPLCQLLLMNDANYPWFILVPRRADVTEVYHLSLDDQAELMKESSFLAENLADLFQAKKMNIAALGNMVPQLHIHHVVRQEDDPAWPAPVWGKVPAVPYSDEQLNDIRERLCRLMSEELSFCPHP
ncbi:HIT domain-containing protein [Marinobacterium mangrovicola]|uniref:Diadenosine tetraphosphate (Ap4A) HIT family hydrolase n=1 Tax=Marinobacterium mangrovicola TaxID=1476959 RepID=A0A4R1GWL9_9GAMM|nr:HIT domain-containing protein [Marinobacterium mangrovicola]TCK08822.1 diadenosine tetraphosphate (Ap4A) HIT family hydrolase [Marinobacterium mangrovicola]